MEVHNERKSENANDFDIELWIGNPNGVLALVSDIHIMVFQFEICKKWDQKWILDIIFIDKCLHKL